MAVYSKLLLSAGGGIVSLRQQAEQEANSATVLIGLGGTGIDCLRTIKTQVHARLKPDDPDAIIPAYEHIRFLGVDTDQKSRGIVGSEEEGRADSLLALDDTEFFSIANSHVKRDLSNKLALRDREELNWLRHEDLQAGDLTIAGAGGIRQVGRYMLMDKSRLFLSRLEQEITAAKLGLVDPKVYVHIFSGLSGGTGAGTFLDVCYMVREVAMRLGGATLFGYFFLPDVNLSRIPHEDARVRAYIPRNGYASMQELDYCMQLQYNGGAFTQTYQDHRKIDWKEAPVDFCHLICATNANAEVVENAYDYAMNVTTEYVMDFLTQSEGFDLESHNSNFLSKVKAADEEKHHGINLSYCVIGASCASLPLREINTYVASELFERFAHIGDNVPTKGDVEKLAVSAFASSGEMGVGQIYDSLVDELKDGSDGPYSSYPDDWRYVRQYGNKDLVNHYTNQTSSRINRIESNAQSMQTEQNTGSLIGRLRTRLADVIRDINRGPLCAHQMLSAAESNNLINVIDGLIAENQARWDQEAYQSSARKQDYDNAQQDFDMRRKRSFLDSDQKRFEDLEYKLRVLEQHKLEIACYKRLDETLQTLRRQVEEADTNYYRRLARVVSTLISTFRENRAALANERVAPSGSSFAMPLMTIAELKKSMDLTVESVDAAGMLSTFMGLLLDHSDEWLQEDENKICKLVNTFFVETAFGDFAGRSITSFLKDKYGTDNDEALTNRIYSEWIVKLTDKARPLFYFNGDVWREDQTSKLAFLSVPVVSAPILHAAEKMQSIQGVWNVKKSALTDRIYVMMSSAVLPLAGYNNCDVYEQQYFSVSNSVGVHYYEGKPIEGMRFNDWRKLPPLTPQSLIHMDRVPEPVRKMVLEARALFERAQEEELIVERTIVRPTEQSLQRLRAAAESCQEMAGRISRPDEIAEAESLLDRLTAASRLEMGQTDAHFQEGGYAATKEFRDRVLEDYFVAAPAHQMLVREIIEEIDACRKLAQEAGDALRTRIETIGSGSRDLGEYCDALFTGVVSQEGRMVIYHRTSHGIVDDIVLSKRGAEYPFGAIWAYQGFVSFKGLSAEDRGQINAEVESRYNADDPAIIATGTKLKDELSDDKINAWAQIAANYAERAEIIEFVGQLRDRFRTFCLENGI